ncbi:putative dolichol kinase [Ordospora colligata]|uniref:Putative dolichol kinase n=1 Tax=Ordospora colligata OC4 TaxID=1354746 RepID=A0A0B2UKY1_9MICR|nr:putative dolichol kinase [Ordospora colligata OC4]KHN69914.1 putative dolichol kinase [Ordospora colligata OC4]TBU16084.1 putative dolichol kinase [Ordospora colligata]TBU16297.1 putative dolichol kinase [Ordospora colligata]TBU19001.1 putative dolichol kinase [Ordospora colligata]
MKWVCCMVDLLAEVSALNTHGKSFTALEAATIPAIVQCIELRHSGMFFQGIKYAFICNSSKSILDKISDILIIADVYAYINLVCIRICSEWIAAARMLGISCMCVIIQLAFPATIGTNWRRKLFHVCAFFVFYKQDELSFVLAEGLLLLMAILSSSRYINTHLIMFLSNNDRGATVVSHAYLLAACVYPRLFIKDEEYVCSLISICFLDTAASVTGQLLGKKSKSIYGMASGILLALVVYFILYGNHIRMEYFLLIGLVEYIAPINDNISIPVLSVLYFRFMRFNSNSILL